MRLAKATLLKKESDDHIFCVEDHVPIGKEYLVDLDTRRLAKGYNKVLKQHWIKEIVNTIDDGGWFPTELLLISELPDQSGPKP